MSSNIAYFLTFTVCRSLEKQILHRLKSGISPLLKHGEGAQSPRRGLLPDTEACAVFTIFLLYLKALIFNWIGVFGILLTLAPLFQPWVERWAMKKQVSLKHLWVAGLVCLFFAGYQAWKDEHSRVDQLLVENGHVANERDFWKNQSYDKDASLRRRDDLLSPDLCTAFEELKRL
jgi:hypothetical protein